MRRLLGPVGRDTRVVSEGGRPPRLVPFAAWRCFLEAMARRPAARPRLRPLHWADDGLLDFVASLVEWLDRTSPSSSSVPRDPTSSSAAQPWDRADATLLDPRAPLRRDDLGAHRRPASDSAAQPIGRPCSCRPAATRSTRSSTCGCWPTRRGSQGSRAVQALIVARLDALPEAEKPVAQGASVTGGVFWSGALAAASGDDRWTRRRAPASARAESARAPITRGFRRQRERVGLRARAHPGCRLRGHPMASRPEAPRVADWVESLVGGGSRRVAREPLPAALDLAGAAGRRAALGRALASVRRAGDRALALHAFAAAAFYRRAHDLCVRRPSAAQADAPAGRALWISEGGGEEELLAASKELRAATIARAQPRPRRSLSMATGDAANEMPRSSRDRFGSCRARALAGQGGALCLLARTQGRASDHAESGRIAREALALAESLGLEEFRAAAL